MVSSPPHLCKTKGIVMGKIKVILSVVSCLLAGAAQIYADEGMWLPSLISGRIGDMQSKGFRLDAEDIYSINQASMKDAVVLFGRGCTGEVISEEGLLLTNHHCGYPQIQKHSTVEHDYLRDGFWAMSRSEELPNEGLTVSFLERMEDVTAAVLNGWDSSMGEAARDSVVRANSSSLTAKATEGGKGLKASVESMYYGNQYFLFVYREFSDIRLVGAPPSSIGKFGGDTDNWMWPRHTGDFSIFRIYADRDNNPAPYSEDNVPYRPKRFFRISLQGVNEGDFTFVYGFPGRTQEYIMSEGVRYISEISDPARIALRTERLAIQKRHMDMSQEVRIKYSSKNAGVANAWKKWQGESGGIRRLGTVASKEEYEKRFSEWAEGKGYEDVLPALDSLYGILAPRMFDLEYYLETARTIEISEFAMKIYKLLSESKEDAETGMNASAGRLEKAADDFYRDYYLPIDKECFIAMMEAFRKDIPLERQPEYFRNGYGKYGDAATWADALFGGSIFADSSRVMSLTAADTALIASDPAYVYGKSFRDWYNGKLLPEATEVNRQISLKYREYMRGQMEFGAGKEFYPDANLTLRVAYGHVKGYSPADGIIYSPVSTLEGIIEKDNPDIFDYNIPQRLREIWREKDYGRWAITGEDGQKTVPVCFLADNHTSGGNSGSPVINADGNLIGINFDRVWEGTMSDIAFDPAFCRNISLDIRYVLFIIDRLAGAGHLLEEMEFVE